MISRENVYKRELDPQTRVRLIRKGNKYFSDGDMKIAERIFITVGYKDGLVRLGDYYYDHNDLYKSAEMYFLSGSRSSIDGFCEKAASIIRDFLNEDNVNKDDSENKKYNKIITKKELE